MDHQVEGHDANTTGRNGRKVQTVSTPIHLMLEDQVRHKAYTDQIIRRCPLLSSVSSSAQSKTSA